MQVGRLWSGATGHEFKTPFFGWLVGVQAPRKHALRLTMLELILLDWLSALPDLIFHLDLNSYLLHLLIFFFEFFI